MTDNNFIFLDPATLASLQTQFIACLAAIAVANQSYSIAGRQFTRANVGEVEQIVGKISFAIQYQSGRLTRNVLGNMSGGC